MTMKPMLYVLALAATPLPLAADVCVTNQTGATRLFTAESTAGHRARADLGPGGTLCVGPGEVQSGRVSVFEDLDAVEGCSRLVPGGSIALLRFANFDTCAWSDHEN